MSTGLRPRTVLLVALALFAVLGAAGGKKASDSPVGSIAPAAPAPDASQPARPVPLATTEPTAAASTPLDVLLVLDNSGSMRRNDPQRLTRRVVKDFSERLDPNTRLGLVLFDQSVSVVLPLTAAGQPTFDAQVAAALDRLTYKGQLTNIPAGIERALYELRERERPGAARVIVLLTDGIVDVGDAAQAREGVAWLRNTLAAEARDRRIQIFGVALTEQADFQLMQSLAQTTGGRYFRVRTAEDIGGAFAEVQESIATARVAQPEARAEKAAPGIVTSGQIPQSTVGAETSAPERRTDWGLVALAGIGLTLIGFVAIVGLRRRRGGAARRSTLGAGAAPATPAIPVATLKVVDAREAAQGRAYELEKPVTRIGRAKDNDIVLPYRTVSAHHAVIEWRDGAFHLKDLGSANGTRHNGALFSDTEHREVRSVRLRDGDLISFDTYAVEFLSPAAEANEVDATEIGTVLLPADATVVQRVPVPLSAADVSGLAAAAADTWTKPDAGGLASPDRAYPAITVVKNEKCQNHQEWPASATCPKCGKGWCEWCLTEKDGKPMCIPCASEEAA